MFDLERSVERKVRKKEVGIRLGKRDFELMRFLIESKYGTVSQIYEMFFRFDKGTAKYCSNRLSLLVRSGFLISHGQHDTLEKIYTVSRKGHQFTCDFFGEVELPSACETVDRRAFIHDRGLVWIRIFLEKTGKAISWESERLVRRKLFFRLSEEERRKGNPLGKELIPDAIFINSKGERCALEFEHTIKPENAYEKKFRRYRYKRKEDFFKFDKLIYVVSKKTIDARIQKMRTVEREDNCFIVSYDDLKNNYLEFIE